MAELAGVLQVQERRVQSRQLLHLTILPPRRRCGGASFDHARSTTHPAVVAARAFRAATAGRVIAARARAMGEDGWARAAWWTSPLPPAPRLPRPMAARRTPSAPGPPSPHGG